MLRPSLALAIMPQLPSTALRAHLSDRLTAEVEPIVRQWIDWLRQRVGSRTIHSLPEQALRNHIPPVLHSLASYLVTPVEAARSETIGHLTLHAQLRKDQGYALQDLLVEFDYLCNIVVERVAEAVADAPGEVSAVEAARAFNLLNAGMRAMAFVTVSTYQEKDSELTNELSRRLDEFASAMVHELRQPLNTVALGARLLASEEVAHDARSRAEYLELVQTSLSRTSDLIDDIRILALSERARVDARWVLLRSLVEQVFDELRPIAERQGVQLVAADSLPAVELDSVRMHLVLLNLVSNAIKYSDPNEESRWVEVDGEWESDAETTGACRVYVRDNGLGIPAEAREHVFQRRFRAHPSHAEGLGLGLSLVQLTLAQIGGRVWIESTSPEGTTFAARVVGRGALEAGGARREKSHDLMKRSIETVMDLEHEPDAPRRDARPDG